MKERKWGPEGAEAPQLFLYCSNAMAIKKSYYYTTIYIGFIIPIQLSKSLKVSGIFVLI